MLNPKDYFQYPYYLPLDGKYQLFQGRGKWDNVLTIKTNDSHSHAMFRRESPNFYKYRWWGEANPVLIRMRDKALG
jgi:hypothetical protein